MSTEVRLSLTARRGPQGLGMGVDTSNVVAQLVQGGQCEADGLLELGDEVVAVNSQPLEGKPMAGAMKQGLKQGLEEFDLTVIRRSAPCQVGE